MQNLIIILFMISTTFSPVFADKGGHGASDAANDANNPPHIGNFAMTAIQQPGPLLSFGQTLIGKNRLDFAYATFSPYHISAPFNNMNAALTYGFSDNTALYFNFPVTADSTVRSHAFHRVSSGMKDLTIQLEHAVYTDGTTKYQDQLTLVGAITLPQEIAPTNNVPTGYGSMSYFWGTTFSRTYVDWYGFVSPGVWYVGTSDHVRLGSQYLYEAGLGRNILYVTDQSILSVLLEFDGQYSEKNQIFGVESPNTGGNIIALTPSLNFSSEHFLAQVGVGYPIVQNLYGTQKKMDYFIVAELTWIIA